jgi:hypothetical protein
MISRRLRLWLVVIVFCLSLIVLLLSAWPLPREQHSLPMPTLALPTPEASTGWQRTEGISG